MHIGHFAFMRAVVQGLDTRDSWNRYLRLEGEHDDIRNVKRTIQWIRDEFAAAARRSDRPGTARLIRMDASRIADDSAIPTLEDFATEFGLEEFSQAEQLEQYREHYGTASTRQSRRSRLVARQLEALRWLETQVVQPPKADDTVAGWLSPELAGRLEAAAISTLAHLIERINGIGFRWWADIGAIGVGKAARIVSWLRSHEATIGLAIGEHVDIKRTHLNRDQLQKVVTKATAIVPFDKLVVPPELNGSTGSNRLPQALCLIDASDDYHAIIAWLMAKRGLSEAQRNLLKHKRGIDPSHPESPADKLQYLSHTQRAYLKEAERLLLWAIVQKKKPLSSLDAADCAEYHAFLSNPTPAVLWCGPRGREKWSPLWRPFEGPLSPSARRHTCVVLKSLYTFLVQQRYVSANPWVQTVSSTGPDKPMPDERTFTAAQWRFVEQRIEKLPATSANRRLGFALRFIQSTGLRLAEAVSARVGDLRLSSTLDSVSDANSDQWILLVKGKGGQKQVPLASATIQALTDYLSSRGLPANPLDPENRNAFLLGKAVDVAQRAPWSPLQRRDVDPREGIAPGTLYDQLKAFFADCADAYAVSDPRGAPRMAAASTGWLRRVEVGDGAREIV